MVVLLSWRKTEQPERTLPGGEKQMRWPRLKVVVTHGLLEGLREQGVRPLGTAVPGS
jgi:hypothetical protein